MTSWPSGELKKLVSILAASVLQSELKVSLTALGKRAGGGLCAAGVRESDICLSQNLRFLASWEMPTLGKTAGCGGMSSGLGARSCHPPW